MFKRVRFRCDILCVEIQHVKCFRFQCIITYFLYVPTKCYSCNFQDDIRRINDVCYDNNVIYSAMLLSVMVSFPLLFGP